MKLRIDIRIDSVYIGEFKLTTEQLNRSVAQLIAYIYGHLYLSLYCLYHLLIFIYNTYNL